MKLILKHSMLDELHSIRNVPDLKVEKAEARRTVFWLEIVKEGDRLVELGVEWRTIFKRRELD
jgi:hypothetical protein